VHARLGIGDRGCSTIGVARPSLPARPLALLERHDGAAVLRGLSASADDSVALMEPQVAAPRTGAHLDEDTRTWLVRLSSTGPERAAAIGELHELLLRAARFELDRRHVAYPHLDGGELNDLAQQSADDGLAAILAKLDEFRGESRFTTWAYKFALYEAANKIRRHAWRGREVPLTAEVWPRLADGRAGPQHKAETSELLAALREEIERALSPHQREVLVALALNEVPIDVLAERLNSTREALYKTLHDARRKLRNRLAARGLDLEAQDGEG
jgi:RNA polymerase sigma-70 factor (ECF subfamily)